MTMSSSSLITSSGRPLSSHNQQRVAHGQSGIGMSSLPFRPSGSTATFTSSQNASAATPGTAFPASNKGGKPVPMKLFATWEVERTPPNCIPRLCSLTLARLVLYKSLDQDLNSINIAVKMQSSKRTLRSNEIPLPPTGLLDTELELTFSLQYPHFLKREGNRLQVMLQRRKKYKNRTILGYKTLATGVINMSQVLQRQMDQELELVEGKGGGVVLGKVYMQSLSSQPVDHEDGDKQMVVVAGGEQDHRVGDIIYSDEEDEFSSQDEGSDSEPMLEDIRSNSVRRKSSKGLSNSADRQRNIRQKFVALLKRFKVNEPEELRGLKGSDITGNQTSQVGDVDPAEIEDLINELEDLSDSGPDVDTISVGSTPKPSLRPFFASSRSLIREPVDAAVEEMEPALGYTAQEKVEFGSDHMSDDSSGVCGTAHHVLVPPAQADNYPDVLTDPEHSDNQLVTSSPPQSGDENKSKMENLRERSDRRSKLFSMKQAKSAVGGAVNKDRLERLQTHSCYGDTSPRKVLLEQLSRLLPSDDTLPDQILLANTGDPQASHLASKLSEMGLKVICTAGPADVRATLTCLVTRLQKFCNTNIHTPSVMRVGLIGSDAFLNSTLRPYVELFSSKPPDWQTLLRFYVIPLGSNSVSKGVAARCSVYNKLFVEDSWRELLEKAEPTKYDVAEMVRRVEQYLAAGYTTQLTIAEAMVTYKERTSDEESSQVFVPFVCDVRVGSSSCSADDLDDPSSLSSSFGSTGLNFRAGVGLNPPDRVTPPSSPSMAKYMPFELSGGQGTSSNSGTMTGVISSLGSVVTTPSTVSGTQTILTATTIVSSNSVLGSGKSAGSGSESELMELQLDYWIADRPHRVSSSGENGNNDGASAGAVAGTGMGASSSVSGGGAGGAAGVVGALSGSHGVSVGGSVSGDRNSVGGQVVAAVQSHGVTGSSGKADDKRKQVVDNKASIRTTFRSLSISHLPTGITGVLLNGSGEFSQSFTMTYATKEKRPKAVLKIGKKKEKSGETDGKVHTIEGICRLICLSKSSQPLKVFIDGQEWSGVKFFQLSSHWQTHIKHFPVAVGSLPHHK